MPVCVCVCVTGQVTVWGRAPGRLTWRLFKPFHGTRRPSCKSEHFAPSRAEPRQVVAYLRNSEPPATGAAAWSLTSMSLLCFARRGQTSSSGRSPVLLPTAIWFVFITDRDPSPSEWTVHFHRAVPKRARHWHMCSDPAISIYSSVQALTSEDRFPP